MSLRNFILRRKGLGWKRDPVDPRDYSFSRMGLEYKKEVSEVTLLPYVSRVLSQGSSGSCVANAMASAIDIVENQAGVQAKAASRLFMYYNSRVYHGAQNKDNGTYIRTACKALQRLGVPVEEVWPFSAKPWRVNRRPNLNAHMTAYPRRNCEYYRIKAKGNDLTKEIRTALQNGHPVIFGVGIDKAFTKNGGSFVIRKPSKSKIIGKHALLIIGYYRISQGAYHYQILNSWGRDWRDGGRAYLTEGYIKEGRDFTIIKGWDSLSKMSTGRPVAVGSS